MANKLAIDELNTPKEYSPTNKPIPYDEYFGDMDLTDEEIEERIAMAEDLEKEFRHVFALIATLASVGALDNSQYYIDILYQRYSDVVIDFGYDLEQDYAVIDDYIYGASTLIIDNTFKNITNGYFVSDDRAMFCAEEETNSVANAKQFVDAVVTGKKHKRWSAIIDKRTRDSHRAYNGTVVPIEEPFEIRGSKLMYPRDTSLGAAASEIVNCRCTAIYT